MGSRARNGERPLLGAVLAFLASFANLSDGILRVREREGCLLFTVEAFIFRCAYLNEDAEIGRYLSQASGSLGAQPPVKQAHPYWALVRFLDLGP
jgi:hypothetical protein